MQVSGGTAGDLREMVFFSVTPVTSRRELIERVRAFIKTAPVNSVFGQYPVPNTLSVSFRDRIIVQINIEFMKYGATVPRQEVLVGSTIDFSGIEAPVSKEEEETIRCRGFSPIKLVHYKLKTDVAEDLQRSLKEAVFEEIEGRVERAQNRRALQIMGALGIGALATTAYFVSKWVSSFFAAEEPDCVFVAEDSVEFLLR